MIGHRTGSVMSPRTATTLKSLIAGELASAVASRPYDGR